MTSPTERTRRPVSIGGSTKGVARAIEGFRKRKEHKKKATAIRKRQYRKIQKQMGYDIDKNKSKREVPEDMHEEIPQRDTNPSNTATKSKPTLKALPPQEETEKKSRDEIKLEKLRVRKQTSRALRQRDRRGRPIMKNIVDDILRKLEHQGESK